MTVSPSTHPIRVLALCAFLMLSRSSRAQPPDLPYEPALAQASEDGERAIRGFRVPKGLKVELFAAEPLLAHPVAFAIDEQGRFYVAETFRLHAGVTDTREHMNWLEDDLACRRVEDRVAMYAKYLGDRFASMGTAHDRVRLVEDRDGDGRADHASVFADGFHDPAVGLGAGVLVRKGDVWYTCIPDLWKLRDTNGDGRSDVRTSLHRGYGVHVGFIGHDLHGLRFGPDGKLYFSIGDRGLNIKTGERHLFVPDAGSVLRCNPDGSELEVFATGLRNPQELAFDEFGNLFTVDNNSDSGDRARLVHVVEGGDSGWRIGYQFLETPNSRGPWNAENLWHPRPENQAAYMLPPLANLADGPSGFAYNPGTGIGPEYRGRFFLADFKGSPGNSGVRCLTLKRDGASFALANQEPFLWGLEATDVDFGPDGSLYVSDWVEGWGLTGKGRIYRLFDPTRADDPQRREVQSLLAEGFERRSTAELARLLAHSDMRIRQEAQFALADAKATDVLARIAATSVEVLARLHAIWGLGQIGRTEPLALAHVAAILKDKDAEVRAQAIHVLGDARAHSVPAEAIAALVLDEDPRVRFLAALAAGKLGEKGALPALVSMLRENEDRDPYLRHAAVMGLADLMDTDRLMETAKNAPASVRLGVLLALRRLGSPQVASFLDDPEPRLVLEAARAIHDVPIDEAMPRLAALGIAVGTDPAVLRRVLNANVRVGKAENAALLAAIASDKRLSDALRIEALDALREWARPSGRDRVLGLWRPLPERTADVAVRAMRPGIADLLETAPEGVRRASAKLAAGLGMRDVAIALRTLLADTDRFVATRVEALKALDALDDDRLVDAARQSLASPDERLRTEGLRVLARLDPGEAATEFERVLESGSLVEKQGAFATLAEMRSDAADRILARWVDRLTSTTGSSSIPPEVRLDLVEAAAKRTAPDVRTKLAAYEDSRVKDGPLAAYRDTLSGGNSQRGRRIFREKAEVACVRCHKIDGQGGEVGPDLTGIGKRQSREYLLESIVTPNAKIAEGFETLVLVTKDGQVHAGVLKGQKDGVLKLMTPEAKLVAVPDAEVEERKRGASAMPEDAIKNLTKPEVRDLVEFLSRSR
jgi:quinoprotein glucose dehydrogenase